LRLANFAAAFNEFVPVYSEGLNVSPPKVATKLKKIKPSEWHMAEVEDCLRLIDETTWSLNESWAMLNNEATGAIAASTELASGRIGILYLVLRRALAIVMVGMSAVFLWGQFTLMGDRRLSVFYQLSHCKIPQIVNIIFVSTPILAYFVFVGSWSLTQLILFDGWYRFIKGATNPNTFNYFSVLLCRLAPTIAWQYLQQIGADGSVFENVMGEGSVVMLRDWNVIAEPILTVAAMLMFAFRVFDKILACCGRESFVVDYCKLEYGDERKAHDLLTRIRAKRGETERLPDLEDASRWLEREQREAKAIAPYQQTLLEVNEMP
jgi:hypothetical protein